MFPKKRKPPLITIEQAKSPRDLDTFLNILRAVKSPINTPITRRQEAVEVMHEGRAFLILDDTEAVGVAVWSKNDAGYYLSEFAICPSSQGLGIGKVALSKILNEHFDCGCECSLHTHPSNTPARKLYESLGFTVKNEIPNFFGDGEPRLYLTKLLQAST
jgi:ribosomal protein S18 acetylase RimI-like enzyme